MVVALRQTPQVLGTVLGTERALDKCLWNNGGSLRISLNRSMMPTLEEVNSS